MSELLTYPHPILLEPTFPVNLEVEGEKIAQIVLEMKEVVKRFNALGLAANQLGYQKSLIIIAPNPDKDNVTILLNPEIVETAEPEFVNESCLSFPGVLARVKRYLGIKVKYRDLDNNEHFEEFFELAGHILQHEVDHLKGVTLAQKVSAVDRPKLNRDLIKGKRSIHKFLKG